MVLRHRKSKLARLTMPVTARVVEVLKEEETDYDEDSDGTQRAHTRIVYTPVLEYKVGDKTYRESHSIYGSSPGRVGIGTSIAIFCNPDNPSEARYSSDSDGLTVSIGAIVLGVAAVFIGIFLSQQ
jgi:hypothetical protein